MSLLHSMILETVVAIGTRGPNPGDEFKADSTGFLVIVNGDDKNEESREMYLVTNRHVFERSVIGGNDNIYIRFSATKKEMLLPLKFFKGLLWMSHIDKDVDISVLSITGNMFDQFVKQARWFSEELLLSTDDMEGKGIRTGDEIYALGFPMGISGDERNYPIARGGIIARLDAEILKNNHYFIDAAIYGGNSGGPVIVKPRNFGNNESPSIDIPYVIGVVSATLMVGPEYRNMGYVVPMERVKETIEHFRKNRVYG